MAKAQPGDVIRMYKLREKHMIGASAQHPAWFFVVDADPLDDMINARVLKISQPGIENVDMITLGEEWTIANSNKVRGQFGDGRYHIIRPEKWPDDISAAVMVLRLQGVIN